MFNINPTLPLKSSPKGTILSKAFFPKMSFQQNVELKTHALLLKKKERACYEVFRWFM